VGQPVDSAGNRRPNGGVQVGHVKSDNRDKNRQGNPPRDPRTNESRRRFFRGQGRPKYGADPELIASAQDFAPYSDLRRNDMLPVSSKTT